ncbi:Hypothetical predicted protein [Marmota monax]|uniref:Uncharacterized protein n=1 Tax=Marmota monax TaxID=9995 RepID=A0A5E4D5L9_MARMO|nr:Hypothetical predicted protein [Marmota monax]
MGAWLRRLWPLLAAGPQAGGTGTGRPHPAEASRHRGADWPPRSPAKAAPGCEGRRSERKGRGPRGALCGDISVTEATALSQGPPMPHAMLAAGSLLQARGPGVTPGPRIPLHRCPARGPTEASCRCPPPAALQEHFPRHCPASPGHQPQATLASRPGRDPGTTGRVPRAPGPPVPVSPLEGIKETWRNLATGDCPHSWEHFLDHLLRWARSLHASLCSGFRDPHQQGPRGQGSAQVPTGQHPALPWKSLTPSGRH